MDARTRILFLIPSLVANGAERQLCELVRHLDPQRFQAHVAVFYDPGQCVGGDLTTVLAGLPHVRLHSLHKRRGAAGHLAALARLLRLALRIRPEVVHGYLDGNLPALAVAWTLGVPSVWGIRASAPDPRRLGRSARLLFGATRRLARHVDLVIFNSRAGRDSHQAAGLCPGNALVIPNGFDTGKFRPDPGAGARQRAAWGVPPDVPLLGIVGRLVPVKDHPTFLRAAALVARERPDAWFACVGAGPSDYRERLQDQARALGLAGRVLWPGHCDAMAGAYNALTLLVLSSTEEGCPNAVGEAMACGIPCVSTRVGDAAQLIGDTGLVTEAGDPEALARAALRLLAESGPERRARSEAAESRIRRAFSIESLARSTEAALLDLLAPVPVHVPAGE